jgi:NAD(P)-dependent dehydrogenase (short-subunit alcohol dehydrogenase family)
VAGPRSVAVLVHSLSGAAIGSFLGGDGKAFEPRQFERTFNYLAHSFAYWAQALHADDLLAPGAALLGLTNTLGESLLHNTGLIGAAKAALEMYVRQLALELGPLGHRVNLLKFGTVMTPRAPHRARTGRDVAHRGGAPRDDSGRTDVHGRGGWRGSCRCSPAKRRNGSTARRSITRAASRCV